MSCPVGGLSPPAPSGWDTPSPRSLRASRLLIPEDSAAMILNAEDLARPGVCWGPCFMVRVTPPAGTQCVSAQMADVPPGLSGRAGLWEGSGSGHGDRLKSQALRAMGAALPLLWLPFASCSDPRPQHLSQEPSEGHGVPPCLPCWGLGQILRGFVGPRTPE